MRFWTTIALILVLSAVGLTYEIAAGRVLAPFFGTSLLTWTAVIATVLAGFSIGSALGGIVAERDRVTAFANVRAALVATAVLMALSPTLLGLLYALGMRGTGGMLLAVVVTFLPPSVFVTVPSPLLAKLALESRPGREGSSLGLVLAAGSVGAILGAILAGFVALPLIGSSATFAGCGAAALVCLLFLRGAARPGAAKATQGSQVNGVTLAAAGFVLFAGVAGNPACEYESGLSCIHVTRQGGEVRLFSDRTMQAAEPIARTDAAGDQGDIVLPYVEWIWTRMQADLAPDASVLFVGGGGYTLPTMLLKTYPRATAVAVEIDPLVTRVVRQSMPAASEMIAAEGYDAAPGTKASNGRLGIVHADGRVYLNETTRRFDAVVMDAFSSSSVPAHLITRETYERIRAVVDGPVYVNLIDAPDGRLARGVHAILAELFAHVSAVEGPVSARGMANIVLVASDAPPLASPGQMPAGFSEVTISPARMFTDDRGWVGHR